MIYYTKIPNQLFDDAADGKLTSKMLSVMAWLHRRADFYSGDVKKVSAARILAEMWGDDREDGRPSERTIQEVLYRLRECRYFKSHHVQGVRGSYRITLNNFPAVKRNDDGTLTTILLNPTETLDWHDLPKKRHGHSEVEICADASDEISGDDSGDASAYRELSSFSGFSEDSQLSKEVSEEGRSATPRSHEQPGQASPEVADAGVTGKPQSARLHHREDEGDVSVMVGSEATPPPEGAAPPSPLNLAEAERKHIAEVFSHCFPAHKVTDESFRLMVEVLIRLTELDIPVWGLHRFIKLHKKNRLGNAARKFAQFRAAVISDSEDGIVWQYLNEKEKPCKVCEADDEMRHWFHEYGNEMKQKRKVDRSAFEVEEDDLVEPTDPELECGSTSEPEQKNPTMKYPPGDPRKLTREKRQEWNSKFREMNPHLRNRKVFQVEEDEL